MTIKLLKAFAFFSITVYSSLFYKRFCEFLDEDTLRLLPRGWRKFAVRLRRIADCPVVPAERLLETRQPAAEAKRNQSESSNSKATNGLQASLAQRHGGRFSKRFCDFLDGDMSRLLPRGWRRFAVRLRRLASCPVAPTEWLRESEWVWNEEGQVVFREDGRFESQREECKINQCRWYGDHDGIVVDYGFSGTKFHLFPSENRRCLLRHGTLSGRTCEATLVVKLPRDPFRVLGISRLSNREDVDEAYRQLLSFYESSQTVENMEAIQTLEDAYSKLSELDHLQAHALGGIDSRTKWLNALQLGTLQIPKNGFYSRNDMIISLTWSTFSNFVSGEKAAAVQFYSPWCPGCRAIVAAYKEAGLMLSGSALLGAVNCESEPHLCLTHVGGEFFQNRADEPRIVLFKDGKQHSHVDRPSSFSADMLKRFVLNWATENGIEVNTITADL